MKTLISRFVDDRSGAASIEYALVAVFLSVVVVTAVQGISPQLTSPFNKVTTKLMEANNSPGVVPRT